MYDLYKPLRNELRKQALRPSLRVIWAWMQHLQFDQGFPPDIHVPLQVQALRGPQRGIYEWELAVLAKELIVLAPDNAPTDLRSWKQFSTAVNKLKKLDSDISERYEKLFRENIFIEMSRHAHHQFGWQRTERMITEVTRYLKIFAHPGMDAILRERLGLDAHALYTIGLSVSGHFLKESELLTPINTNLFGISSEQITLFFNLYARDIGEMRRLCTQQHRPAAGTIHHSDRGSQYCAEEYQKILKQFGFRASMSRKGNCFDNAPMESFWGSLKTELVHHRNFATRAEAESAIREYIEVSP